MQNLFIMLEILKDQQELRELGLEEEEVIGYLEFFIDNYELKDTKDGRREGCSFVNINAKNVEQFRRNI